MTLSDNRLQTVDGGCIMLAVILPQTVRVANACSLVTHFVFFRFPLWYPHETPLLLRRSGDAQKIVILVTSFHFQDPRWKRSEIGTGQ